MPDLWIDLIKAIERVCTARDGSVAGNKMAFIQACVDGLVATRHRGDHRGHKPSIPRLDWAGADIDLQTGRVIKANGEGMMFVDVNELDLQAWLQSTSPSAVGTAGGAPQFEAALDALRELFPNGVPEPKEMPNKDLVKQVTELLQQKYPARRPVGKDQILRAAKRRK